MKESNTNIQRVAVNLTCTEFHGYCKGMAVEWLLRAADDNTRTERANKKFAFWDSAYDKYKHTCKLM